MNRLEKEGQLAENRFDEIESKWYSNEAESNEVRIAFSKWLPLKKKLMVSEIKGLLDGAKEFNHYEEELVSLRKVIDVLDGKADTERLKVRGMLASIDKSLQELINLEVDFTIEGTEAIQYFVQELQSIFSETP